MYLEIKNDHPLFNNFIELVKSSVKVCEVRAYKVVTYIDTNGERLINFFSSVSHDVVMISKDKEGKLLSFPLALFGTIYEL